MFTMNWSTIRPFKGSQHKGFEQLCFQLALQAYQDKGEFTVVDDTGGGDGVEFYQTRADGQQWGWQAKFYDGSPRLSQSGRKQKIINSLKKALQKHPRMVVWILCTNSDFTTEEQSWFNKQLINHIPNNRKIRLEHWSESRLGAKLDLPACIGIKNVFFGVLQLSDRWFQSKFDSVRHLVEEKFRSDLHTKDQDLHNRYIAPLLVNQDFHQRFADLVSNFEAGIDDFQVQVRKIVVESFPDVLPAIKDKIVTVCKQAETELFSAGLVIHKVIPLLSANHIEEAILLTKTIDMVKIVTIQSDISNLSFISMRQLNGGLPTDEETAEKRLAAVVEMTMYCSDSLFGVVSRLDFLLTFAELPAIHHLHLLGEAGIGKTHISTALARSFLDVQLPVIFVPAIKFAKHDGFQAQLLRILDISSYYTFDDFIDTLNVLGRAYNMRVPIIIDGLNESINERGILNPIWKLDIRSLEQQLQRFSNVCLLTTCRKSYAIEIWPVQELSNIQEYNGFVDEQDRISLIRKYFRKYRLFGDLTYLSLSNFAHPLFLKIFCETKSISGEDRYIQIGSESIYDIFREFVCKCDASVFARLKSYGYAPVRDNKDLATHAAGRIGKTLWESNARSIPFDTYLEIFSEQATRSFFASKSKAVIDEGLLLVRDRWGDGESVGFTYDLMAGYCIANYLVDQYKDRLLELVCSESFIKKIISFNYDDRHPLADDIRECFTALVPMRTGSHLFQIVPEDEVYARLRDLSVLSLFKLSSEFVRNEDVVFVRKKFDEGDASFRKQLLEGAQEVLFVPTHPLNFLFFSRKLSDLSLTDKDLVFCEFIRRNEEQYWGSVVAAFSGANKRDEEEPLPEQVAATDIVAVFFVWSLATNIKVFRNEVSKALYQYGRRHSSKFLHLFKKGMEIDDIYIRERLVAVAYGLVSAYTKEQVHNEFVMEVALFIFQSFFEKNARPGTTHILLRDYANLLIEAACRAIPTLAEQIDVSRIRPPYNSGGIRKWEISDDKDKDRYREGNAPMDFFFDKDELPRITKEGPYKAGKRTDNIKGNILWRIYELGYVFDDFEIVDQQIARRKGMGRNDEAKVEKYGEKYVWIAYYELAGYLEDQGLLSPHYEAVWRIRHFGEKFDPTFPEPMIEKEYFNKYLLGAKGISIRKWLDGNNIPDISNVLIVNDLTREKENFVLLDAYKCQSDGVMQRQLFFWVNAIFANTAVFSDAKKAMSDDNPGGNLRPHYQEILFHGEYPYSAYFPSMAAQEIEWPYKKARKLIVYEKKSIYHKGKELSSAVQESFWNEMEQKYSFTETRRTGLQQVFYDHDGNRMPDTIILFSGENTPEDLDRVIAEEMKARGYELRTIGEFRREWKSITKPLPIFVPILATNFGSCITKEIVEACRLDTRAGSIDLYDEQGKQASISFRGGDKYNNNHQFTYLRKDLLDQFLKMTGQKMFWRFNGEWNHWLAERFAVGHYEGSWRKFSKTIDYSKR